MTTFKRDQSITYTQMAMWVDANAYTKDCDIDRMYQYIYHLASMLAKKKNFFNHNDDYDKFALYVASRMIRRYQNAKQYVYKEDGTPIIPKVKSVLNYLKKSLHLCKIDFQNDVLFVADSDMVIYAPTRDLGEYMINNTNVFDKLNFCYSLGKIDTVVRQHLSNIPYKKDSCEWHNIYMSCMLSLLNSMTMIKKDRDKLLSTKNVDAKKVEVAYTKMRYESPILFHLEDSMSNYIRVLVNELKHCLSEALTYENDAYISSDDTLKGIIVSSLELEDLNEY